MTTIPVCIFCENEASEIGEGEFNCSVCKEGDGVIVVNKSDWNNEELTFEEIKERAE